MCGARRDAVASWCGSGEACPGTCHPTGIPAHPPRVARQLGAHKKSSITRGSRVCGAPAEFREDEAGGICARPRSRDGARGEGPRTEEFDAAEDEDDDARPRAIPQPMQTAEIDVARDRRVTLTSPIPAVDGGIDGSRAVGSRRARDPAAPEPEGVVEQTRRVGDSDPVRSGSGPTLKSDVGVAPWRQRAAQRIDEARAALEAGDLVAAVTAAEAALHEADEAPPPGSSR